MPADIQTSLKNWSTTEASNAPSGATSIGTNLDDNLRQIQATVRQLAAANSVASAGTTDLGAIDETHITITGTTTITSLGTVSAGIYKWVIFSGALTLTHNATSLILPTGANLTTAAGDCAYFLSLGSGNWRCLNYAKANGAVVASSLTFGDGTVSAPGIAFTADTDTGIYRIGPNSLGISAGGVNMGTFGASNLNLTTAGSGNMTLALAAGVGGARLITLDADSAATGAKFTLSGTGDSVLTCGAPAGSFEVTCGNGTSSGNGGQISFQAGTGQNGSGNIGSSLILKGGSWSGGSGGGDFNIQGGSLRGAAGGTEYGGNINIKAGYVNGGTGGWGGNIFLYPGGNSSVASRNGEVVIYDNTTQASGVLALDYVRHWTVIESTGKPTISSGGGTGATINGNDNAFVVTLGTSPGTTLVITYSRAYNTNAPIAVVSTTSGATIAYSVSTSTTQCTITFASTPASATKVYVQSTGWRA